MGTCRLALSLLVVASHFGGMGDTPAGGTAVSAFFTISGFLMARTIAENYGGDGYRRFYLNRLIRLGPPLAVVMALTASMLWIRQSQGFRISLDGALFMPVEFPPGLARLVEWNGAGLPNLLKVQLHLVPQGWSLVVEAFFYLLAPIGVALASRRRFDALWIVTALSFGLAAASTYGRHDLDWLRSPTTGLWTFVLGLLAYFHSGQAWLKAAIERIPRAAAVVPLAAVGLLGLGLTTVPIGVVFLVTPALIVAWLLIGRWRSRASGRVDQALGDTAYGVFVGHFLSVMAMLWIAERVYASTGVFGIFGTPDQARLHTSAYVASMIGGILIYWLVERPFWSLRSHIRQRRHALPR